MRRNIPSHEDNFSYNVLIKLGKTLKHEGNYRHFQLNKPTLLIYKIGMLINATTALDSV